MVKKFLHQSNTWRSLTRQLITRSGLIDLINTGTTAKVQRLYRRNYRGMQKGIGKMFAIQLSILQKNYPNR